jgi:Protein of unknown function (DUF2934)
MEPDDKTQEASRGRAYEIWEREGRNGDPLDHWYRAKWELDAHHMPPSERFRHARLPLASRGS